MLEKTVSETPRHNEIVERINHNICEKILCMLTYARLPKSFWDKAIRIAMDLTFISPLVPLNGDWPKKKYGLEKGFIQIPSK